VVVSRIMTLTVGVAGIVIALLLNSVIGALTVAYDLLTGALFVPIMAAILWPAAWRRQPTPLAAVGSMIPSSVVVVVLLFTEGMESNDPIIFGLLTSLVLFVGLTLAGRRPAAAEVRPHRSLHVPEEVPAGR
jgi:SSS family solute:Na+ symporter